MYGCKQSDAGRVISKLVTIADVVCEPAHFFGQKRENKEGKNREREGGAPFSPALFSFPPPPKKMSRLADYRGRCVDSFKILSHTAG